MLVKYHAGGDANSKLLAFELAEIEASLEVEKTQKMSKWLDFLRTPGNRRRLMLMTLLGFMKQWSGNGLVSYYLTLVLRSVGITDSKTQLIINGCTQVWSFLCASTSCLLVDRFNRRSMFISAAAGMLVSYCIWTVLSALANESGFTKPGLGYGVVTMIFAYQGFYHISGPIIPTYVQEINTFSLRSKGTVIEQFFEQCANIFNGFVNPIALRSISWRYYIVYCIVLFAELFIYYFLFPETRGLSLEECSAVFDGHMGQVGQEEATRTLQTMEEKGHVVHQEEI